MKLEPPLALLFERCMTICVAECCGIDAYDFHPAHIASFLLMHTGSPDPRDAAKLREQFENLKVNYGSAGASGNGATFEDINQGLSGVEIDALVGQLTRNLDSALELLTQYTEPRKRSSH
jgi:hypothetical protein